MENEDKVKYRTGWLEDKQKEDKGEEAKLSLWSRRADDDSQTLGYCWIHGQDR